MATTSEQSNWIADQERGRERGVKNSEC
jgi:hypothetical protein